MPVNPGEVLNNVNTYLVATGTVTAFRIVMAGTGGASAGGTTKLGAVRNVLTAASTSGCYLGWARGSASGSGQLIPVFVDPGFFAIGTADLGTGKGTEVPWGVALQTQTPGLPVSVAEAGCIVKVETDGAIKPGDRVGATGTNGKIVAI